MENENKKKVLIEVNQSFAEQSSACNKHCRKTVYVFLGTAWGLLIPNPLIQDVEMDITNRVILMVIIMLCAVFFIIETCRYFKASKFTMSILEEKATKLDMSDEEAKEVCDKMLKISIWTHNVLKVQMGLCFVLAILFGVFVLNYCI